MSSGRSPFPFSDWLRPDLKTRLELFIQSMDAYHERLQKIQTQESAGIVSADDIKEAFSLGARALTELKGMETGLEQSQLDKGDLLHSEEGVVLYHIHVFAEHFREAYEAYKREIQQRFPHLRLGNGD